MVKYVKARQPTRRELRKLERPQPQPTTAATNLVTASTSTGSVSSSRSRGSLSSSYSSNSLQRPKKERARQLPVKPRLLPRARKRGGRHKPIVVPNSSSPSLQRVPSARNDSPGSESETSSVVRVFKHRVRSSIDKIRFETQRLRELQMKELLGSVSESSSSSSSTVQETPTKAPLQKTLECLSVRRKVEDTKNVPPSSMMAHEPAAGLFTVLKGPAILPVDTDDPFIVRTGGDVAFRTFLATNQVRTEISLPPSAHLPCSVSPTASPSVVAKPCFRPPTPTPALKRLRAIQAGIILTSRTELIHSARVTASATTAPNPFRDPKLPRASQSDHRLSFLKSSPSCSSSRLGLSTLGSATLRPADTTMSVAGSSSGGSLAPKPAARERNPKQQPAVQYKRGQGMAITTYTSGLLRRSSSSQLTTPTSAGCSGWFRRNGRGARVTEGDIEAGGEEYELGCDIVAGNRPARGRDAEGLLVATERSALSRAMARFVSTLLAVFLFPWRVVVKLFGRA